MLIKFVDSSPFSRTGNREAPTGRPCAHCRRRCGTWAGGYAVMWGRPVCYRPHEDGRPDCYTQILTGHRLIDCPHCLDPDASVTHDRRPN